MQYKDFNLDAYEFITGVCEAISIINAELNSLSVNTYSDRFKNAIDIINKLSYGISKFIEEWESDDIKVCSTLDRLKSFCGYYCETLSDSTPSLYYSDSKYIKESLYGTKLVLFNRLTDLRKKLV